MGAGKTIAPGDFPRQEVVIDLLSFGDNLAHPAAGKQVIAMRVGNFKLTYATPASAIGVTTVIPHTVRIILMVYIIRGAYGGHQPFVEITVPLGTPATAASLELWRLAARRRSN